MRLNGPNVVFVGNIPFDISEEAMIEIFQECGPVVNFEIKKDKDTGRPRGFGFCEFHDEATANSAVRNLDGYQIGDRTLNVRVTVNDPPNSSFQPRQQPFVGFNRPPPPPAFQPQAAVQNSFIEANRPSINTAAPVVNQQTQPSVQAINDFLATMTPDQIFELITQINVMIKHNSETAKTFLSSNQQLCYALYQAIIMMELVDEDMTSGVLTANVKPTAAPPSINKIGGPSFMPAIPTVPSIHPSRQQQLGMEHMVSPQNFSPNPAYNQPPPAYNPLQQAYNQAQPNYPPPPAFNNFKAQPQPQHFQNFNHPPPPFPQHMEPKRKINQFNPNQSGMNSMGAINNGGPGAGGEDQEQLIREVMQMPQAVIDRLPDDQRMAILRLRAQYMGRGNEQAFHM